MNSKSDIYKDILAYYFNSFFQLLPEKVRRNIRGDHWRDYLYNIALSFFKAFKDLFAQKQDEKIKAQHWLFVLGQNNLHSLEFLEAELKNPVYVCPYRPNLKNQQVFQAFNRFRLFYMIWKLPLVFRLLLHKESKACPDRVVEASGLFESYVAMLKRLRPKSISFSNDHNIRVRAMILAAEHLNIPTFYIQHACVLRYFPPLRFSCSFLEGQDALDKYTNAGERRGDVHLVGIPRMDAYVALQNSSQQVRHVGVCSSTLDSIEAIGELLALLRQRFPALKITYRPHPGDKRVLDLEAVNVQLSNSRDEPAFQFLGKLDLIIAGNSSIHYEALCLNVVPVYYKFDQDTPMDDIYDFCKKGKVVKTESLEQLCLYIEQNVEQKENVHHNARYFNAALDSTFEGNSVQETVRIMKTYLG